MINILLVRGGFKTALNAHLERRRNQRSETVLDPPRPLLVLVLLLLVLLLVADLTTLPRPSSFPFTGSGHVLNFRNYFDVFKGTVAIIVSEL